MTNNRTINALISISKIKEKKTPLKYCGERKYTFRCTSLSENLHNLSIKQVNKNQQFAESHDYE